MSIKTESGWSDREFCSISRDVKPSNGYDHNVAVVDNCKAVNLRAEPSLSSAILAVLGKGVEVCDVHSANAEFYSVKTSDGVEGYIKKDFLKIK